MVVRPRLKPVDSMCIYLGMDSNRMNFRCVTKNRVDLVMISMIELELCARCSTEYRAAEYAFNEYLCICNSCNATALHYGDNKVAYRFWRLFVYAKKKGSLVFRRHFQSAEISVIFFRSL